MQAPENAAALDTGGSPSTEAPTNAMFALLYGELRRLARSEIARAGPGVPLSATTLLHEAYLALSQRAALSFPDKPRFLAYAARAMRTLIIDHIRERGAQKRGGDRDITSLDTETAQQVAQPEMLSEVSVALDELALLDPQLALVVDLKFFCGFSLREIADQQSVSERTVQRQWQKARALLYCTLRAEG